MATDFQPTWALIQKPSNYPTQPTTGKIEMIYSTNAKSLYHRFSPYANYNENSGFLTWGTQPFYYIYADENKKGLNALKKYESRLLPIGDAPIDVIRVSKFLISGAGIGFLAKQFLLQTGNVYNETRIYNPLSPVVAAGMSLVGGNIRPNRNFDTSGGLAGIVGSLGGGAIMSSIFGAPKINPPSGTTGVGALPTVNATTGGKGLLRASTANTGKGLMESKWGKSSRSGGFLSAIFSNFIPQTQTGIVYKSDEGAYGLMIKDLKNSLWSDNASPTNTLSAVKNPPSQMWIAGKGGKGGIRKENETVKVPYRIFGMYSSLDSTKNVYATAKSMAVGKKTIPGVGPVGYDTKESTIEKKPGIRYDQSVGSTVDGDYQSSDVMLNYYYYAQTETVTEIKRNDTDLVRTKNLQMKVLLDKIRAASNGGVYNVTVPTGAKVISSDHQVDSPSGYDLLFKTNARGKSPINYPNGVMQDYRNNGVSMVSNDLTDNRRDNSKKLPTNGWFDAINTLEVLGKDKKINNSKLKTWDEWSPYKDDLIALYFYDVVNEKYIPFRAAMKGLSEAANASWEEMPFIGRGDKIYTYGGFNRNLSMTINIVISSLVELAPTWQRINYLATLIKPANYTTSKYNGSMNRFMVPPMVMLTLGDMYKDQPVLIQSVTTTIPDDAIWETQHQIGGEQWKYLANFMNAPANVLFGQLPRTVDISLTLILLEKERAVVGGANFGHAPRDEQMLYWNTDAVPDGGSPTKLHRSLVVDNIYGQKNIYSKSELDQEIASAQN